MADIDLTNVLNSGGINSIYLGGTTSEDKVLKKADLGNLEQNVLDNSETLTGLQEYLLDPRKFEYAKTIGHTVTDDTYEEIARLTTISRPAGVYQLSFSIIFTYNTTGRSGFLRISIDGGSTWHEFRKEAKDTTDKLWVTYVTAVPFPEQIHDIIMEARKENSGDIMEVGFANIISEYKES